VTRQNAIFAGEILVNHELAQEMAEKAQLLQRNVQVNKKRVQT
jgi:hypothetical protein